MCIRDRYVLAWNAKRGKSVENQKVSCIIENIGFSFFENVWNKPTRTLRTDSAWKTTPCWNIHINTLPTHPATGYGFQNTRNPAVWNSHPIFPKFLIDFVKSIRHLFIINVKWFQELPWLWNRCRCQAWAQSRNVCIWLHRPRKTSVKMPRSFWSLSRNTKWFEIKVFKLENKLSEHKQIISVNSPLTHK